ncbi:sarcoplasmic reticulum histidine-rich calcium-binding protein isoform X2 [Coregonus clupeaformis]|uniref:sarcoplasmic reticulum histidine-rich calcium-binding protein isoform X2 n=1 Tax=Coregonus clupeaformis TaxID=59861 RepID=UPI001E1C3944|nr:sarcoplasmic reticulum histidine-rich calcium-binding protein isoform X2 [Coregonus clupeaformis]
MEQNSADLLTDAFSDTSLPSFPEGELDFESLHFDEAMSDISPGMLPVLREEEEDVGQEEEEPGGETGNVSDHISVETYDVRVTEEDTHHTDEEEMGSGEEETQHIDEEEMGSGEEETQHIDEEEMGSGEEETQHIDELEIRSGEEETQHIDEEEIGSGEEETQHIDEEEIGSGEEETQHIDEEEIGSGEEETQHIDEEEIGSGEEETQHIDEEEIGSGEEETQHIDEEEIGSGEEETQHIDEEEIGSGEEETQHIDEEEIGSGEEETQHIDEEEIGSGEEETQHIDEEEIGSGEEETQHIDEEEIGSEEEETQHIDEEEIGSGEEETQHVDEEEIGSGEEETQHIEEEAEMMDSGEEENTGIKNLGSPGDWSVVVHYDEESWDGALQDIEKIVTTGQPFAEQESENHKVRNVEQGAYENSDVRCFEGVTEDGTMEITAGICEEGERRTAEENQEESSDSDLEILTSSVTKQRRKEGNKAVNSQQTFPQEKEEEEERDEDGAPEVVSDCPDPAASVADLHLSETISDVPTSTLHGEAGRGRAAVTISRGTGNMSSSDSEESFPGALWTSEAEQREDKRETWLWGETGPGTSEEEHLCEVQPELAGRLKSRIHTDISWDTGGNNVDSGGLIQDYQYEASGITESGELAGEEDDEEDDEEENRSWEQEKERIKAFHKFYYDEEEEENGENTGRKSRVQFCVDPLPQVIEYTDSSDVDLVDSSSDGDEDLDSTARLEEQREPERQRMSLPETQESREPQGELQDLSKMPRTHRKRDRCLRVLKLLAKMTLLTAIGLLAFWWTRDQLDLDW